MGRASPKTPAELLEEATDKAQGWAMFVWCIAVVLFLFALVVSVVCKDYLERVSRVPARRRPPLLAPTRGRLY
jgi:hypothetical protein